jgi:hypothetical protein
MVVSSHKTLNYAHLHLISYNLTFIFILQQLMGAQVTLGKTVLRMQVAKY